MTRELRYLVLSRYIKLPQVVVSRCQNIFQNLALEDWIYNNVKFANCAEDRNHAELVMIWRNKPCIVVGRHQNSWAEADVYEARNRGVSIARRRSGGGCVYHDLGNINFTFFTSKKFYNRKRNLNFVSNHLREKYGLDVGVNCRDDIVMKNTHKVSGTAAKLGSEIAYHHLTLLINADLEAARSLLCPNKDGVISKATVSTPSPITNLTDYHQSITPDLLIDSFVKKYSYPDQQVEAVMVDPEDLIAFEGIEKLSAELKDWSWVFGHTPKFHLTHSIPLPSCPRGLNISIEVEKGLVKNIEVVDSEMKEKYVGLIERVVERMKGVRLCVEDLEWGAIEGDDSFEVILMHKKVLQYLESLC